MAITNDAFVDVTNALLQLRYVLMAHNLEVPELVFSGNEKLLYFMDSMRKSAQMPLVANYAIEGQQTTLMGFRITSRES